jgi:hypothetical protein
VGIEVVELVLDGWFDVMQGIVVVEESKLLVVLLLDCVVDEISSLDEVCDL